jgi:hypothetical protein
VVPEAPGWFGAAACGLALFGAAFAVGAPAGLALSLLGIGAAALLVAALPSRDAWARGSFAVAALLFAVASVRDAGWVVALSTIAGVGFLAAGAAPGWSWRALAAVALRALLHAVPGPLVVLALVSREAGGKAWARLVPVARGLVLAGLLLVVFVPLFAAADAAFAELLDDAVRGWSLDRPVSRAALAVGVLALLGALHVSGRAPAPAPAAPPARTLTPTEWTIALGALVALFSAFVAVQVTTLFGGHEHVLQTAGLTYAEYAHQGYGQLVAVALLTLGVIAGSTRWAAGAPARRRALLGALCLLTLVVLASALKRLAVYEDAYGLTRLRLFIDAHILWIAGVFVAVLVAGALRREAWLPRAVLAWSAVACLAFVAANPDARIYQRNLAGPQPVDGIYLEGLSADAACAPGTGEGDGVAGFNLARARCR